ncbi:MAG: hypothetical protein HYR91_13045 [Flavobacteriia bacterium]|nr:hypothetical protein [Flavobacteriia bacterium]
MTFVHSFSAQYFEFKWSDKIEYTNNKDGFFSGFINTNEKYIYTLNSNYAKSPLNKNSKIKLIVYNKSTMEEVGFVALKGFPENKGNETELTELNYYKTVILEDRVLVFWTKLVNTDSTKLEDLYVESFKVDLVRDKSLRKVYSSLQKVDYKQSEFTPTSIVVIGNKIADKIVIGSEYHELNKNIVFNYFILSSQLTLSNGNQVNLPTKCKGDQNGLTSTYDLGADGNVFIRTSVDFSFVTEQPIFHKKANSFLILTVINPLTKDKIAIELKGENKTITDFSYINTGVKTKIFGFFGDLIKDPTGRDKQGIFYTEIDNDTLKEAQLKYTYFEKTSLNKLFPKSKGGRKTTKGDIKQLSDEELNTRFDIENIFLLEDSSCVLFFTRKYNYTEITSKSGLNGENEYTKNLYCEKNNVSAIRINNNGIIMWTSNIERSITYQGTDISDVRVIQKLNKFYVIFGTENTENNTGKEKRKKSEFKDNIDYATFDLSSGRAKKLNLLVNEEDVIEEEKREVNPNTICVFDGNFYFNKQIIKQKIFWNITNVIFFPSIYYSVLSGNTKKATGDLGVLYLLEGKPIKKKSGKR